jgi:Flp pilus assembly protein TadD
VPPPTLTRARKAAESEPQPFWAHFYCGIYAYRQGQYAAAVEAFDRAVALEPTAAEVYYNRARAYAAWGKSAEARRDYDRALEQDPRLGVAWLNRGVLHYQEQQYSQAAADLEQALRNGADPVAAHYKLALVAVAEGNRTAAWQHVEQVLSRKPAHADARALREQLRAQR